MTLPSHGANPKYVYGAAKINQPDHLLDFSVNVNPFGAPSVIKEKWMEWYQYIEDYPDPLASQLKKELSTKEGIAENCILIGNGGAEIITLVAQFLKEKRVLIIQPAFSEYEQACLAQKCIVEHHILKEEDWTLEISDLLYKVKQFDAIFLCTPNNPTGVIYDKQSVIELLEEGKRKNCYIIIDEAFYDFSPNNSTYISLLLEYPNLIVLRSLTKMFAIAGLRLGYGAAHPKVIKELSVLKPHWSVNAIAMKAGIECIFQDSYILQTKQHIEAERRRLEVFYKEYAFQMSDSKVNFYLLKDPSLSEAAPLFHFLLKKGIVPRHTMNFPGLDGRWLRFAIKRAEENNRLMEALVEWKNRK
ncbi:threonine-phosphate decarboxylase CobD [Heyndrickxia sp. NPDC080065]|uniref:threonine-phosphate decarboxylase CobD n=1 Tax=Heyndrickxia sp. NPDC080065 TaxID=3390568 RepID=UPI003CFE5D65